MGAVWWNGGTQYTNLSDAYISVIKSLQHACLAAKYKLEILWIEAAMLEDKSAKEAPEKVSLLVG
jgi:CTP synthase